MLNNNKKKIHLHKKVSTDLIYLLYFTHILQQNTKPVKYGCLHRQIQKPNKNIVAALMRRIKGGYLDFSHLTELENIYITEIYMRKQYKSSKTKNHKIKQKYFLMVFP